METTKKLNEKKIELVNSLGSISVQKKDNDKFIDEYETKKNIQKHYDYFMNLIKSDENQISAFVIASVNMLIGCVVTHKEPDKFMEYLIENMKDIYRIKKKEFEEDGKN